MHNQFEIETTIYGPKPITGDWGARASIMVPSAGKKNGPSFLDVIIWNKKEDGITLGDKFLKSVNDRDKVLLRGQLRSDKDDNRDNKIPKFVFRVDEFQPTNGGSLSGASDAASFFGGSVAGPADTEAFLTDEQIAAEKKKKAGKV